MVNLKPNLTRYLSSHGYLTFGFPQPIPTSWKSELQASGMKDTQLTKCVMINSDTVFLHSIRDYLVDSPHPKCPHVTYRIVSTSYKHFVLMTVMPQFASYYELTIPDSYLHKPSKDQISKCWQILRSKDDITLLSFFSPKELALIKSGDYTAYTWHHSIVMGVMLLVPSQDHKTCGHTGGNSVWSYGT